ncbi:MAG: branched-chain amino acid transaminase [Deltaproteobacteria bacterium]|nr:branched-chain amino acid transaminase [Deltaproteobacteria bacterium]
MIRKEKLIWMDGQMVEWDDAKVHVLSHTLHYGYGAFEGIRSYKHDDGRSAVFRLPEHVDRLFQSSHLLELGLPFSREEVNSACVGTLAANGLAAGYIRPLVYLGQGEVGVYPGDEPDIHLAIATWKWGAYLGAEALKAGIRVKVSSYTKFHVNSVLIKGKVVGHYVNSVLAKMEAKREGYSEGILLDHQGYVAEGSGENLFIVRGKTILTPDDASTILGGITRDSVITLATDMGYDLEKTRLTRNDLYTADEVFFTGTAAEITPIREIDRRTVGEGRPGPVALDLQRAFFDVVAGRNRAYDHWMTYYSVDDDALTASTVTATAS